jgi:hypothetical protein
MVFLPRAESPSKGETTNTQIRTLLRVKENLLMIIQREEASTWTVLCPLKWKGLGSLGMDYEHRMG